MTQAHDLGSATLVARSARVCFLSKNYKKSFIELAVFISSQKNVDFNSDARPAGAQYEQ
jgi:hypothetical protein